MKTILKGFLVAGIGLLTLVSCNKDKNDNRRWGYSVGYVTDAEPTANFTVLSDQGNTIHIKETDYSGYKPAEGQRIIPEFYILSENALSSGQRHYEVHLVGWSEILTKEIVEITAGNDEELGNDGIAITDHWIANDYLTIEFQFRYNGPKKHFVNLGIDESKTYQDDKVHLEFRHNAYGDTSGPRVWGLVSFKLESLKEGLPEGTDELDLVVHSKTLDGDDIAKNIKYIFGANLNHEAYSVHDYTDLE